MAVANIIIKQPRLSRVSWKKIVSGIDSRGVMPENRRDALREGGVPERPKGADCKSAGSAFGGSNPPPSTILPVVRGMFGY